MRFESARRPGRAVVLDPFAGTGTTGQAAQLLGRDALLIDLAGKYTSMCRERVGGLFSTVLSDE